MKPNLHVVTEDESVPCRSYRDWLDDKGIPKGPWIVRAPAADAAPRAHAPHGAAKASPPSGFRPTGAGEVA